MDFHKIRALRGANVWTRKTVLEVRVGIDPNVALPAALSEQLGALLPELDVGSALAQGGAPTLAHLLERVVLSLQTQAGCALTFSRVAPTDEPGVFEVVVEYGEEEVGRKAFEAGRQLVLAALAGRPFEVAETVKELRRLDQQIRLGPSTGSIVRAAMSRGIPVRRLNDGSLVQFGWGVKQHRILAAETDNTSAIAETIAQDKELTKTLLRSVGVPVPDGRPVEDADDAWAAAQEIGVPVVVKPRYGNQGRGVAVNLRTREQVLAAYSAAREEGSSILVERFTPGLDHRFLVIGDKVVAAARRSPPQVFGDGVRTIRQLVDEVNLDPRRGEDHATSLSKIPLDAIALAVLAELGMTADSVPDSGQRVVLRRNANLSTGGSATDVTDDVHPDFAARVIDAAKVIGLDIAGIDVMCHDVTRPLEAQGGALVEVNAAPGFRMHLEPSYGKGRPVGEAVVSMMFSEGNDGRVPVTAVSGNNGKTTTVRLIAHLLRAHGKCVGMTCTDGVYLDDRRIDTGDCSGPKSARAVLVNPRVEAAVLETARGGILREGLGFDRCDVAVMTNIGEGDHLGMNGITTAEQLAALKRIIVENVAPRGMAVLNAADRLAADMAQACPGAVTFFALDKAQPVLAAHRAKGGRVVFVENGWLIAAQGKNEHRVAELREVPLTRGGQIRFQVENVLAALAAGWANGIPWSTLRTGLESFLSDFQHAPGRFNMIEYHGATVIVDYGHNADALEALVDAVDGLSTRRRVAVLSAAGDRRDVDIQRLGQIVGDAFDEVIAFEDACNRGRPDGAIIALLKQGMAKAGRVKDIAEVRGELRAMQQGLDLLRPGDLGLLLIDEVETALAFIEKYTSGAATTAHRRGASTGLSREANSPH